MSNEINAKYPVTGVTLYAVAQQIAGAHPGQFVTQVGPAVEAYTGADWTTSKYCVALAELTAGGSAGYYQGSFPAVEAGDYAVSIYLRSGASPATTDAKIAGGKLAWNGAAELATSTGLATIGANLDAPVSSRSTYAGGNVTVGGYAGGEDPATLLAASLGALEAHGDANWRSADPWQTALPGSYADGTAGKILGAALADLLEADRWIDTSVSPWAFVLIRKGTGPLGTGSELLRQALYDTAGAPLTASATVIGRAIT